MSDGRSRVCDELPERPQERLERLADEPTGRRPTGLQRLESLPPARVSEPLATLAREVIGALAAVRREAFRGARADGLTLTEIADELGVSVQRCLRC
ncbi:sigma factor-like helix-turn-helix DNA-binding protein [Actinomadura geliboluensis]|uniref:sigma factor-like helix-turn-helix DNA-binding protein n=1 Tax=Actinomadura geliboluensis TaxID=882440 RepID=UPI0037107EB1